MKGILSVSYILLDFISAGLAWTLFFAFRKVNELQDFEYGVVFSDTQYWKGVILIPLGWLILWFFLGSYDDIMRKSRIKVALNTLVGVFIGCTFLFFTVIRDDLTIRLVDYLVVMIVLTANHLLLFQFSRLLFLSLIKLFLNKGLVKIRTVFIGRLEPDWKLPRYIHAPEQVSFDDVEQLKDIDAETIIIGSMDEGQLNRVLPRVIGQASGKAIHIHESSYESLTYNFGAHATLKSDFLKLSTSPLPAWQRKIKRFADILLSLLALVLFTPLLVFLAWRVKKSSPGEIVFKQSRIGRFGIPFEILKFRSMYIDAEESGPQLALENDPRCTKTGLWMRRWRLDELPQFVNVLRGEMSFVGPRPERSYYTDQLLEKNNLYALLWQVRPGITSWGQIKFGYAGSVQEMVKRFRFDLLYVQRMSIFLDLRILYYTIIVLIQGKGR